MRNARWLTCAYIDKFPICDDNFFGVTWNLYYMEGLAMYQSCNVPVTLFVCQAIYVEL